MQMTGVAHTTNAGATTLAHRLDVLGWGSFFLMTGILMLFPSLPEGTWLVGLGVLLLGLAAVRVALGLAFEWFGVILGTGALLAGFGTIAGIYIPVFALFLVACGLALIASVLSKGRAAR
jgi:apolipoprotein N-acyltransferase